MNHLESNRPGTPALPCSATDPTDHAGTDSMTSPATDAVACLDNATVDLGRKTRCRFGEVIYGEGKSPELIVSIARTLLHSNQEILITRVDPAAAEKIAAAFPNAYYAPDARTIRVAEQTIPAQISATDADQPIVVVVTAGSTDLAVAAEAVQTLTWMRIVTDTIHDVGVAGPQRLLAVLPRIQRASVIVVVAGMEGALASVVGGHVACPVIAVPTSVGYGSCFQGLTALLAMSVSCASNVSVVGIDAGFKGGYVAGLIATQLQDCLAKKENQPLHRS